MIRRYNYVRVIKGDHKGLLGYLATDWPRKDGSRWGSMVIYNRGNDYSMKVRLSGKGRMVTRCDRRLSNDTLKRKIKELGFKLNDMEASCGQCGWPEIEGCGDDNIILSGTTFFDKFLNYVALLDAEKHMETKHPFEYSVLSHKG